MVRWRVVLASLVVLSILSVGCGDDDESQAQPVEWGYEGDIGPDHWGDLSPEYAACSEGTEQSPIDIDSSFAASLEPALEVDYRITPLVIFNNGHTVEVEYAADGALTVGGDTWEVRQFHFHAPSEHTLDGVPAAMELHVVHQNDDGERAVVGVLIEEGTANSVLAPVFENLPTEQSAPMEVEGEEVDLGAVLPDDLAAWRYDGSLTTPPCSEGVRWHVVETPITASATQIDAFTAIFDNNSRPTQSANGRPID